MYGVKDIDKALFKGALKYILVFAFSMLCILVSAIMQLVYGVKMSNNNMTERDKGAGIYFITIGVISILFSVFLLLVSWYGYQSKDIPMPWIIIFSLYSLLVFASSIVQIIYGLKIKNNKIEEDDEDAGKFLISLGSINIAMMFIFILGGSLLYIIYSKKAWTLVKDTMKDSNIDRLYGEKFGNK